MRDSILDEFDRPRPPRKRRMTTPLARAYETRGEAIAKEGFFGVPKQKWRRQWRARNGGRKKKPAALTGAPNELEGVE